MTLPEFLRGVWAELAKSPGFLALCLLGWLLLVTALAFGVVS